MASIQELADATDQAILDCLTAQSYSVRGRSKQMAMLKDLLEARKNFQSELQDNGQMVTVGRYVGAVD